MRRKLIRYWLKKRGLTIAPIEQNDDGADFPAALDRLRMRQVPVATVIDVGASNGVWSREALRLYPNARYLCIEAQPPHERALRKFAAQYPNVEYILAAAGAEEGKIYFDATDLLGGVASYEPCAQNCIVVPVTTIDQQVAQRALKPPYLIKLDTHGFEVPILAGAARTLEQTEILVIEVYNFKLGRLGLYFWEMCQHLAERGFRCLDLYDTLHRPRDQALWQMDMVFARANRPEFSYLGYQ